jgi:YfiH family protein
MTSESGDPWYAPDWPLPPGVRALQTVRGRAGDGGKSGGPWCCFNLGDHVGDVPEAVIANRAELSAAIGVRPRWMRQIHGVTVCDLDRMADDDIEADAAVLRGRGQACVVMTADCLPVLLCAADGSVVAAAHAGWRGLLDGVIEAAVGAMQVPPADVRAWLGPAIGVLAFEVGPEVREAFVARDAGAQLAFAPSPSGRWLADLAGLARQRLAAFGVNDVCGGGECTFLDVERFYSYRRDGITGRMATLIWRE